MEKVPLVDVGHVRFGTPERERAQRRSEHDRQNPGDAGGGRQSYGRSSFGIGVSFVSSVQMALAIHQRFPSQKSSIELMPRMITGPDSVRRDSYVLQTWAMGPKRSVTRWISFSKKPVVER